MRSTIVGIEQTSPKSVKTMRTSDARQASSPASSRTAAMIGPILQSVVKALFHGLTSNKNEHRNKTAGQPFVPLLTSQVSLLCSSYHTPQDFASNRRKLTNIFCRGIMKML